MASDARVHRFTTAEFERMVETGALADLRVELLDGLLIDVPLPREPHVRVTQKLMRLFAPRIELLRVEMPLLVAEGSTTCRAWSRRLRGRQAARRGRRPAVS